MAKAVIGVAVKAGQSMPPLATVEDFKQTVLRAHKVAYIDPDDICAKGMQPLQ